MLELQYKTKGNAQPKGKPRVFFTCHPADMKRSLDTLCSDIFQAQDCAVYYTEDMTELIGDEDRALQLEQMNLFVVPVSLKLLIEPNRAMDQDVPFARDKHIPILPIMLEPGLDVVYSREDKFGPLQYLDPEAHDITAISYEEKLKKYLSSVLIDDETAERVRKAFDAYIFLSYRKKDRKYANELMRLIHADPQCRDIAIWYDEYLTPGESFSDAIQAALDKSELFTLLVTPNLVNEENYIQTTEYPAAKQSGKPILPVEMAETDRKALESQYHDIPACTAPDDNQFRIRLLDSLRRIALRENDANPTHNYLIGLAYLNGIDVEVDKERGIELINSAAESGLIEAMRRLRDMYLDGADIPVNYQEAVTWAERIFEYCFQHFGSDGLIQAIDKKTGKLLDGASNKNSNDSQQTFLEFKNLLVCLYNQGKYREALRFQELLYKSCGNHRDKMLFAKDLAATYDALQEYHKAIALREEVYEYTKCNKGEDHPDTLISLNDLGYTYGRLGHFKNALALQEKTLPLLNKVYGDESINTLRATLQLAVTYRDSGDYKKALALLEKSYSSAYRVCGKEHPNTLYVLHHLGTVYQYTGYYDKAKELLEQACGLMCSVLGESNRETLDALHDLSLTYKKLGDNKKVLELTEQISTICSRVLGEDHSDTLTTLYNLSVIHGNAGSYNKVQELLEPAYPLMCRVLGEDHPVTLNALLVLTAAYRELRDYKKALELLEKTYPSYCRVFGEEHKITLSALENLAYLYSARGDWQKMMLKLIDLSRIYMHQNKLHKALEKDELIYNLLSMGLGEEHSDTLASLSTLALTYGKLGNHQKALESQEKVYTVQCRVLGEDHPDTLRSLNFLAATYGNLGEYKKLKTLNEKAYDLNCRVFGEKHPNTLGTLNNLACTYEKLGDYQKAVELHEKAYPQCVSILGEEHPGTLVSLGNLTYAYEKLGNTEKAKELRAKLDALRSKEDTN